MKKFLPRIIYLIIVLALTIIPFASASAYSTELVPDNQSKNDFVLGGGKINLMMDPGESVTKEISLTNRLGKETTFKVEIEDFSGTKDLGNPVVLNGLKKGPYSLRDYIHPEVSEFTLKDGERISLPVTISIPKDSRPGGLYGAIAFSDKYPKATATSSGEMVAVEARLAYLFLVRVKGDVTEEGALKSFSADKDFYEKGPATLNYVVENSGNVHLNPYGVIKIKNIAGKTIEDLNIEPFYSLPESLRKNTVTFNRKFLLGKYTATLELHRGYLDKTDVIDTKVISFWVVPWKILILAFAGLVLIGVLIEIVVRRFKIVRKDHV
jgi:hypothetical protein